MNRISQMVANRMLIHDAYHGISREAILSCQGKIAKMKVKQGLGIDFLQISFIEYAVMGARWLVS